jgi:hypothetical protein
VGGILGTITGSKSATKKAVKAANYAADQNALVAREGRDAILGLVNPTVTAGNNAGALYDDLLGIPGAPSATAAPGIPGGGESAFQNYLNNFGFTNELDRGSTAIRGNLASRRLLGSGATLKALQNYGLGLRDQYRGNYLNLIGNRMAAGVNAAGAAAGATSNYTGQVINSNNARASAIGNAALAGQASNMNFLGAGLSAAAMLSDRRAKTDIRRIGKLDDGTGIFSYRYKGDDKPQVGVIAQDAAKKHPEAVKQGPDGLLRVNYLALTQKVAS